MGKLYAAAFASSSTSAFSALSISGRVNPWNLRSRALTVARYLTSSGSRAMYSFSTCLAMTWESVFTSSVLARSAFALLRPSMRPSYSAILFVALNSNLAAYFHAEAKWCYQNGGGPSAQMSPSPVCVECLDLGLRLRGLMCQRCPICHKIY